MADKPGTEESETTPPLAADDGRAFQRSLEQALEQLRVGLMIVEGNKITYSNEAYQELVGYSSSELAEIDVFTLVPGEHERHALRARAESRRAGTRVPERYVTTVTRNDGRALDVEVSVTRFQATGDGLLVLVRDVTELTGAERRARRAQRMEAVGQLAAGIVHDFTNYLATVRLISESLQAADSEGEHAELLEELDQVTAGASQVTRQLTMFSGQDLSRPVVLDINVTVFEMYSMLQRLLGDRLELVTQLEPGLTPVCVDAGQLQQIIVNLVMNAQRASADGARVTIETRLAGDEQSVCIAVRDEGAGMTSEVQERALEPYFTTRPDEASGMGLAIVYGIVTQYGGSVDLESSPGEGTCVSVVLPATTAIPHRPRRADPPERLDGESPKILLLEDEARIRALLVPRLAALGFSIKAVSDGYAAMEALEEEGRFDVLVADIVVPGPQGVEVARTFREKQPDGAVVFVSGYPEIFEPEEWSDRVVFLPKPFSAAELAATIRSVVAT